MPTVIDSLVVQLGLDPKKFTAGHKEAQSRIEKFDLAIKKLGVERTKAQRAVKVAAFPNPARWAAISRVFVPGGTAGPGGAKPANYGRNR
jgi:hypothetical protein